MHIVIDIRSLQPNHLAHSAVNESLKSWLTAFLKMPYEHRVSLLIDPRLDFPHLDMPLTGSFWQTIAFESHPKLSPAPSREAELLACYNTNQFLLERKADLFHLTSPFELAPVVVGYPPIACRSVATAYDTRSSQLLLEQQEDRLSAPISDIKMQALVYLCRVVMNSELAALGLVVLTNIAKNKIDLISEKLSPREMALAIRETYTKALAEPFVMTSWGVKSKPPTANELPAADFGLSKLPSLATQADVADREYTVQSKIPVVGAMIARIRREMTSHLREPYFDPMIERQVLFNQKLVEALRSACQILAEYEELVPLYYAQKRLPNLHPSQDIIDEALQSIQPSKLLNPHLLAGPLPEYGDCLGRDFYEQLYTTTTDSFPPNVSKEQKMANQSLIVALTSLAQQIEAYYQHQVIQQLIRENHKKTNQWKWDGISDLVSQAVAIMQREYKIDSDKPYIGWVIAWIRRHFLSQMRQTYIDPILEKQEKFNRLLAERIGNLYEHSLPLQELKYTAQITLARFVTVSAKPIVGPLITWWHQNTTSHLREPYMVPIFQRQQAFNLAVVEMLATIKQQLTSRAVQEDYDGLITKFNIKRALYQLKEPLLSADDKTDTKMEKEPKQIEFSKQAVELIDAMTLRIEECL